MRCTVSSTSLHLNVVHHDNRTGQQSLQVLQLHLASTLPQMLLSFTLSQLSQMRTTSFFYFLTILINVLLSTNSCMNSFISQMFFHVQISQSLTCIHLFHRCSSMHKFVRLQMPHAFKNVYIIEHKYSRQHLHILATKIL